MTTCQENYGNAVVEGLHDRRGRAEVLEASRRRHVQVVARDHVDLDLPLAADVVAVGDHRQDDGVGRAASHVDIH